MLLICAGVKARVRLNTHGVIGLMAMSALAYVGIKTGGAAIVIAVFLIAVYGALILVASRRASRGDTPERDAEYEVVRGLWMVALHAAFLLIAATFYITSMYESLVALTVLLSPMAVLLAFATVGLCLTPGPKGWTVQRTKLLTLVPVVLLITIAALKSWQPAWYPIAGLALYHLAILARLMAYERAFGLPDVLPWPFPTHPFSAGNQGKRWKGSRPRPDRPLDFPLELFLALTTVSLGLLIDLTNVTPFAGASADVNRTMLQICIFVGAAIAGYSLPSLLLVRRA